MNLLFSNGRTHLIFKVNCTYYMPNVLTFQNTKYLTLQCTCTKPRQWKFINEDVTLYTNLNGVKCNNL